MLGRVPGDLRRRICERRMKLKRARHDRRILGVCGGIAHTYGLNPRGVGFLTVLVAIIIPGFSVIPTFLAYLLLGLLLPISDEF